MPLSAKLTISFEIPTASRCDQKARWFLCFAHLACLSFLIAAPSAKPKPKSLLHLTKTASSSREGGLGKVIFGLPQTGASLKTPREKRQFPVRAAGEETANTRKPSAPRTPAFRPRWPKPAVPHS